MRSWVDAADSVGAALADDGDALLDQVAGDIFQFGRNGVLQVHVDEIAAAMPGVVDETLGDDGHGQTGTLEAARMVRHLAASYGTGTGRPSTAAALNTSRVAQASARSNTFVYCRTMSGVRNRSSWVTAASVPDSVASA